MTALDVLLTVLACAALPLVLLAWVSTRDRPGRWRLRYVALAFTGGMFAAAVGFFVFEALGLMPVYRDLVARGPADDLTAAAFVFGVVGPVEEALKLAAVVLTVGRVRRQFRPVDGFVFASASALGFAATENWYAMWATGGPDPGRAAVVPFVHLLFASFIGWGLARSMAAAGRPGPVYLGVALAAFYHGLHDFLEFRGGWWHFATMPLVVLLWLFLTRSLSSLARASGTAGSLPAGGDRRRRGKVDSSNIARK